MNFPTDGGLGRAVDGGVNFPVDGRLGRATDGGLDFPMKGGLEGAADGGMLESVVADGLDWGWAISGLVLARAQTLPRHRKMPSLQLSPVVSGRSTGRW